MVQELQKQLPAATVRQIDALENCRFLFRVLYVWTYWAMIRYAPHLWKRLFEARLKNKAEQTAPRWALRWGFSKVFTEIGKFQPEIIAACEVGAAEIAVLARREKLTGAKIVNVITDFEAEPIWIKPEIAAFAVATKEVAGQLQSWGAGAEKIKVCGIPLKGDFAWKYEKKETFADCKLDDKKPLVLVMGGGMGPTRMNEVIAHLLQKGENLQILALPGRDKKMHRRLARLSNNAANSLHVLHWTNRVAALMQAASILVTKPGGVTLSEAAVCSVPLVLFDAIPGPEVVNAARFAEAGAAHITYGSQETAEVVLKLLKDAPQLQAMAENIESLAQPQATAKIAQLVIAQSAPRRNGKPFDNRSLTK